MVNQWIMKDGQNSAGCTGPGARYEDRASGARPKNQAGGSGPMAGRPSKKGPSDEHLKMSSQASWYTQDSRYVFALSFSSNSLPSLFQRKQGFKYHEGRTGSTTDHHLWVKHWQTVDIASNHQRTTNAPPTRLSQRQRFEKYTCKSLWWAWQRLRYAVLSVHVCASNTRAYIVSLEVSSFLHPNHIRRWTSKDWNPKGANDDKERPLRKNAWR